jgi:hypothetical protein
MKWLLFFVAAALCEAQFPPSPWPGVMVSQSALLLNAGRSAYSSTANKIAYDQLALTGAQAGYFQLWIMSPNGTNQVCLTCSGASGASSLPGLNCGNPHWSPSGAYIAFQCQALASLGSATADFVNFPGSGWNNDVWATDTNGHFYQLTNQGTYPGNGGVIYPTFSQDGTKLAWGQRLSTTCATPGSFFGGWELAVASWSETGGMPSIGTPVIYKPTGPSGTACYYEPHGFDNTGANLFFMGNVSSGMQALAMDIYSFNLSSQVLTDLTNTPDQWNEFPTTIPGGTRIVYMSTTGTQWTGASTSPSSFQCDLWSMNYDGSNPIRFTFFNQIGSPVYNSAGICLCDPSWNQSASDFVIFDNINAVYHGGASRPGGLNTGQTWILNNAIVSSFALGGVTITGATVQ